MTRTQARRRKTQRMPTSGNGKRFLQKHTKTFEGKEYHLCPLHKKWMLHKPDKYCLKDKQTGEENMIQMTPTPASEGEAYATILNAGALADI